jgi:hypothetical protein
MDTGAEIMAEPLPKMPPGFTLDAAPTTDISAPGSAAVLPEGFELDRPVMPPAVMEGRSSLGGELLTGLENTLAAGGQRTTPNIAAYGQPLGPATIDELGYVHYKNESGEPVYTDQSKHVVLQDPRGIYQVYARSPSTEEGRLSALGHIIGPGLGASALPSAGAVALPAAVQAGARIGVNVPRAITNPAWRAIGQVSAKAPGGGPLYEAIGKGVADLGRATEAAVETAGGPATAETAGGAFRAGAGAQFGRELPDAISGLYNEVDHFVDPNVRVPLENTRAAVADIMARETNIRRTGVPRAVSEVFDSVQSPEGLNYAGVKDLRTVFRELKDRTPEGFSRGHVNAIYDALSNDLRASVEAGGGPEGLAAFEKANRAAYLAAQWEEKIGKVLGTETRSNEDITRAIQRMAGAGAGADFRTLVHARAAVPPEAWQKIAANTISKLGRDNKGDFSPALFLRDYNNLSDQGKRVLFHAVGSGDIIPHLDDIATVSEKFVAASKLANPSGTAAHATHTAALIEGIGPLLSGDIATPLKVLGGVLGNRALARFLSQPATAASTARWARAYQRYVASPTSPRSLTTLNAATRNLGNSGGLDSNTLIGRVQAAVLGQPPEEQTLAPVEGDPFAAAPGKVSR